MLDKLVRYGVVERLLKDQPDGTILDVGAGPHGLGSYLPYAFVGVDVSYPEPPVSAQKAVRASATALPFPDLSFDYVLCIEVLEHLSPELRPVVVSELCRVARRRIIISHPYGRWGRAADRIHYVQYSILKRFGKRMPEWILEHAQNELPVPNVYLPEAVRAFQVSARGQENWFIHNPLVLIGKLVMIARQLLGLQGRPRVLNSLLRLIEFPPYYRLIIVMDRITN